METITCRRCGREAAPALERPPFKNDLGRRVHEEICRSCWGDWLQHQTLLINHYGLDVRNPEARKFLYAQLEAVLLEEGDEDRAEIDTTREGEVSW